MQHSSEHFMFVRRTGEGPTIVWIHGLGESGLCFERFVERLPGYHHVIPDLPGYGRSGWPTPRPPSLAQLADNLAFLDAPAIVIGHSMGGVIGVELAERWPDNVRALVNIEGNVSIGDCTSSARAAADTLDDFVARGFDALAEQTYRDGAGSAALRGAYASLRFADPRSFHRHAEELVAASRDESMAARLAALRPPQLYVAGVPGGAAARTLELLAQRRIRTARIEPAGHWPFIDRPDDCARAIGAFLRDVA